MSGPKGGSIRLSAEAHARIGHSRARDELLRVCKGASTKLDRLACLRAAAGNESSLVESLRGAIRDTKALADDGAAPSTLRAMVEATNRLQAHREGLERLIEAAATLDHELQQGAGAAEQGRINCCQLLSSLGNDPPTDLAATVEERSEQIDRLESEITRSRQSPTAANRTDLAAELERRARAIRSAALALRTTDWEFGQRLLDAAVRRGVRAQLRESVLADATTSRSETESDTFRAEAADIRAAIDGSIAPLAESLRADFRQRWREITNDDEIGAAAQRRLLVRLHDSALAESATEARRERIRCDLARAEAALEAIGGKQADRAAGRLRDSVARALALERLHDSDLLRVEGQCEESVAQAREQRRLDDRRAFVQRTVRESLEELGYRVDEDVRTITFGPGTDGLVAEAPAGEWLVVRHGDAGQLRAEIVVDSDPGDLGDDRVQGALRAMEAWCEDYEQFAELMREKGLELDTQYRHPATRANLLARPLTGAAASRDSRRDAARSKARGNRERRS